MERGRIYGKFTGEYGELIEARGSSSIEPECWLEINSAKDKNDYMGGDRVEANALLSYNHAILLRTILDNFISQVESNKD